MGIEHRAIWVRPVFGLQKGPPCVGLFLWSTDLFGWTTVPAVAAGAVGVRNGREQDDR